MNNEEVLERLAQFESVVEEQAEVIEEQRERLSQLEGGNEGPPQVMLDGGKIKVIGEISADNATGVLGKATGSGTTCGVKGEASNGYGLYTPHDAKVDGTTELSTVAGSLTGGKSLTDLAGTNLSINSGSLDASGSQPNISDDGTTVVAGASDINFGSGLAASDDSDGTASASIPSGAVTSSMIADDTISNTDLKNDSISISAGNGLVGGGSTSLGGTTTIDVQPAGAEVYLDGVKEYQNPGNWSTVDFNTKVADDANSFSTTNSRYHIPVDGDYDVDVNLNLSGIGGGSLLEARVISPSLSELLMYTKTGVSQSDESISLSKILKQLGSGTTLEVQLKYDDTAALDGGSRDLSTWSINKVA